jgi:antitoxin HigA-1
VNPKPRTVSWNFKTATVPHPGALLWTEWLEPLDVTVGQAAAALGVSRKTLSAIVNGRQGITAEMSIRLSKALNVPEDAWLRKQREFDLSQVDRRRLRVRRLTPDSIALDVD